MKKNILFLIILSSSIASSVKADFKEDAQNFFRNMGGALRNTGRTLRNTATGTWDWINRRLGLRQNNAERNIELPNNADNRLYFDMQPTNQEFSIEPNLNSGNSNNLSLENLEQEIQQQEDNQENSEEEIKQDDAEDNQPSEKENRQGSEEEAIQNTDEEENEEEGDYHFSTSEEDIDKMGFNDGSDDRSEEDEIEDKIEEKKEDEIEEKKEEKKEDEIENLKREINNLKQQMVDQQMAFAQERYESEQKLLSEKKAWERQIKELESKFDSDQKSLQEKNSQPPKEIIVQEILSNEAEKAKIKELEEKLLKIEEDFKNAQSINEINKIEMIELNNINNDLQKKIELIKNQKNLAENELREERDFFKAQHVIKEKRMLEQDQEIIENQNTIRLLEEENNNLNEKIKYLEKEKKDILEVLDKLKNSSN